MLRHCYSSSLKPSFHKVIRSKMSSAHGSKIMFGPFEVTSQVFLATPHSFALVNLKPLLPGHVLVCPHKPHKRLTDLSLPEVTDLFSTVQRVQALLARHYFPSLTPSSSSSYPASSPNPPQPQQQQQQQQPAGSFSIALQDGPEAGQTVPHVHVHIIPRIRHVSAKPDDGTEGDALYDKMAGESGNVGGALWDRELGRRPEPGGGFPRIEDSERKARTMEEMEREAELYRRLLEEVEA
ncbi:Dinucleoside triphosphate hydrolase [Gnomoniopsis smithogilvyi]|uniref:Bis(5'-adenosyl)-triphosphatase n=1 Tax=Gnomoniopsis smithogilvyi TaxID=1191159 RepID=A0A9W8YKG4_9PEZI|nr:Dinucleoside triphosphate hydrolase [Gnomoniopsis smithogilvyi]